MFVGLHNHSPLLTMEKLTRPSGSFHFCVGAAELTSLANLSKISQLN